MNIFIFQQREWYFRIGQYLAKYLIDKNNHLGCLTFKKTTHKNVLLNSDDYKLIINHDEIVENPENFFDEKNLNLNEICKNLKIASIWELMQSARNHVKNYNTKPSYGFSQNLSDDKCINYFKSIYQTAKRVHRDFNPNIIILPAFVSLPHIIFNLYFNQFNIPTIGLIDTKIDKNFIFVNDYLSRDGRIFKLFNEINISRVSTKHKEQIQAFKKKFFLNKERKNIYSYSLEKEGFKKEIKIFFKTVIKFFKSLIKKDPNLIKSIGYTPDNNVSKIIIRDYFYYIKNKIQKNNFKYDDLENIKNYIFFPLQCQPEDTIDILGVKYNNQIETIRQIAMRLPGDICLVVKDHPAMIDLRETKYLNKIKKTPNVKLISSNTSVDVILDRSKLVIYISGTISFECAMKKVPCIQLGEQGLTKLLPNVKYCDNINNLTKMINEILYKKFFDQIDYEQILDKYIFCVQKIGFDYNYLPIWEKNEKGNIKKIIEKFYDEIKYYISG